MLSAEQLAARRHGIGSSDVAALCGEDPFKTPFDLFLDKTGQVANETNEQAELGHVLEPIIAAEFAKRYGVKLERPVGTFQHPDHPIVLATLDRRIVGTNENLECKNTGYRMIHKWRGPAFGVYVAPPYVQIQGQWQAAVSGAEAFWIAALLGGRDFYFERFDADEEYQAALIEIAERFWRDHVEAMRAPDPDHTERTRKLIEKLHPAKPGLVIPSTDEIADLATQYSHAKAQEKDWKKAKDAAGNKLRKALGEAVGTEPSEWGQVFWQPDKTGRTSWTKVIQEIGASPSILAELRERGVPEELVVQLERIAVPPELIAKHTGKPARKLRVVVEGFEDEEESEG